MGTPGMERRNREHFDGSNKSDVLGPVAVEPWSKVPTMVPLDKAAFWGDRRKAVGGRNPGDETDNDADGSGLCHNAAPILPESVPLFALRAETSSPANLCPQGSLA